VKIIYIYKLEKFEAYLYSKGFFIVQFSNLVDYQKVLEEGPWFCGRVGLFVIPLFPFFNTTTMSI
jgi:hypothetical protein